jgi:putative membrane protein
MSLRHLKALAAGGLLIAAVPPSPMHAQAKPTEQAKTIAENDSVAKDASFIHETATGELMEVRLGEIAGQKATNPAVKQYGERMVTDHQKLEKQWTEIASKHGMPFEPGLGPRHREKVSRVQRAGPRAFDREFMATVIGIHEDRVPYFEKEGMSAHSAPVRKLVTYELPLLREQLLDARRIGKEVGVDSAEVERSRNLEASKTADK